MNKSLLEKFLENRRLIVELIFLSLFFIFVLDYLGIPDRYDFYIYWFFGILLLGNVLAYIRLVLKDLKEILKENEREG